MNSAVDLSPLRNETVVQPKTRVNKHIPSQIISKLLETKDNEEILKSARKITHVTYRGTK